MCDGKVNLKTCPKVSVVGFLFQILQSSLNMPVENITLYAVLTT